MLGRDGPDFQSLDDLIGAIGYPFRALHLIVGLVPGGAPPCKSFSAEDSVLHTRAAAVLEATASPGPHRSAQYALPGQSEFQLDSRSLYVLIAGCGPAATFCASRLPLPSGGPVRSCVGCGRD